MQIELTRTAQKGLKKMPAKDRAALLAKLKLFAETKQGDVKKLQGADAYRLRHGNYRAIFEIENNILVIRVAHRKEVYD